MFNSNKDYTSDKNKNGEKMVSYQIKITLYLVEIFYQHVHFSLYLSFWVELFKGDMESHKPI